MPKFKTLLPSMLAVSVSVGAAAVLASAALAYERRSILSTAPTRQLIAGDNQKRNAVALYSAEIARAPVAPALLSRWIAANPSASDRSRGLALLRQMGFRNTEAQVSIMVDDLLSGNILDAVERVDGLLAQNAQQANAIETLARMERTPQFRAAIVTRLNHRPRWRSTYLFNPALLGNSEGRQARLQTLTALDTGSDTLSAYAFASQESWKHHDFATADAFWQRSAVQRAAVGQPIGRLSFPFEWRAMTSADFEVAIKPQGNLIDVSIDWSGKGLTPFVLRNQFGPIRLNAQLARIMSPRTDGHQIAVIYRCQGAGWIVSRPILDKNDTIFLAPQELPCPDAEVAIVPAARLDGATRITFKLSTGSGSEGLT